MITEIREWTMLLLEFLIALYVIKEYYYDRERDIEKKQKKTKTTKKTTKGKEGGEIVEETTETSEPVVERNVEGSNERDKR